MTGAVLTAWRKRLKLTKNAAATELGLNIRTYRKYENGDTTIPRYVALACTAILHGHAPYGESYAKEQII